MLNYALYIISNKFLCNLCCKLNFINHSYTQGDSRMKSIIFTLIFVMLLCAVLFMIPTNVIESGNSKGSSAEYSTIVPAKPPSTPPKQ